LSEPTNILRVLILLVVADNEKLYTYLSSIIATKKFTAKKCKTSSKIRENVFGQYCNTDNLGGGENLTYSMGKFTFRK
jgi:hypothetical protein